MDTLDRLADILQTKRETLEALGHREALDKVLQDNDSQIERVLKTLNLTEWNVEAARRLREIALEHDAELRKYVGSMPGDTEFDKAAALARQVARVGKGFFLKKEFGAGILKKRPPQNLLAFFKYSSVDELLAKHEVTEIFSALRFMESDEWMHETFDQAYSSFTAADFEERDIELKVLGPEWHEVAKKFVEKKHHNVSHLKEFGVIFLNPIAEDMPGKFLRDFALLFHYFHEVEFYSKMFRRYAAQPNFADNFKMLLRGDVKEAEDLKPGEWLIVQRYFWKLDAKDARLFIPRVNPESLHWRRGEMDLTHYAKEHGLAVALWEDLDWVGTYGSAVGLRHQLAEVESLDLEDNAMAAVSLEEGRNEFLNYHQREAVWLKIFTEIVGGEANLEKLVMDNFQNGIIRLEGASSEKAGKLTLKATLEEAARKGVAVGHFNITEIAALKAIIAAAKELNVPVMIGTSEGEREFLGVENAVALVRDAREKYGIPVFLNADHTHSVAKAKEAVDAGYDEILFDGGVMTLEENIKLTKEVVAYAKAKNPDIMVEGELGNIGSGSVIRESLPEGIDIKPENLTTPEQAKKFVEETGVDMLAPAVGNLHGLLAHAAKPRLDIARVKAIKDAVGLPLVLHGGSGTADEDFTAAIKAGITVVHINTEIRKAFRDGIVEALQSNPNEVTPSKILGPAILEMQHVVNRRLKLFNGLK